MFWYIYKQWNREPMMHGVTDSSDLSTGCLSDPLSSALLRPNLFGKYLMLFYFSINKIGVSGCN